MRTYKIMLQSASDIITNSSSEIYEENGHLVLSYPIMCNISEDIFDILLKRFGAKNVKCEYYG